MTSLTRDQLIQVFEGLTPIMPTAKYYIQHLQALSEKEVKIAELIYTTFIQTSDFTKEVK